MNDLISVIVPIYNVEKYLLNCYTSIAQQTYSNLDIILVDDGSTDCSGQLCDEIARKDRRVRVLHKENEGLGYARNSGLKVARGKYVLFVDSDDFIELEMVQKLYERIEQYDADTSYCGFSACFEGGKKIKREPYYKNNIFKGKDIIDKVLLEMIAGLPDAKVDAIIPMSSCCALYSLDIIQKNNLWFLSERHYISEDILFNIDYLRHANCVSYIGEALYNYRYTNSDSLTHKFDKNEIVRQEAQYLELNRKLSEFITLEKYDYRTKRYFLGRVRTCINKAFTYAKEHPDFHLRQYVKNVFCDKLVRKVICSYPYNRNPFKIRMFNFCIRYKCYDAAILLMKFYKIMYKNNRF